MKLDEAICGSCGARVKILIEYSAIERRRARPIAPVGEQFDWDNAMAKVHRCGDRLRTQEISIIHV